MSKCFVLSFFIVNFLWISSDEHDSIPGVKSETVSYQTAIKRKLCEEVGECHRSNMEPEQTPLTTSVVKDESPVPEVNTPIIFTSEVPISSDHVCLVNVTRDSDQCPLEHPVSVSVLSFFCRRKGI
ncbi:hypothetical protein J6590_023373 [Homalodisca vitripennis]|nr:hypothetical protein J6590_023373 [Homalodisca vitripennis]